ncbi:MAG: DUF423 domain-containing protein [Flavobacteriales bacterium]|nr:DUF423 domain-containing protein [Flavobacteriales bacterium]
MDRASLAWASALLLLGVALGAFGAHGLKPLLGPAALDQWHTAVLYHFIHALGLLGLSSLGERLPDRTHRVVRFAFIGGVICFSGSLYLLSTRTLVGWDHAAAILGPITPLGGLLFMLGWAWLLITALRKADAR